MKKTIANIDSKLQTAQDWLRDPTAVQGGLGEKSLRAILGNISYWIQVDNGKDTQNFTN